MTKDEFIRRFRNHLVGVIVTGRVDAAKLFSGATFGGVAEVGAVFNGLGSTADATLAMLYDALQPKPNHEPLPANGVKVVAPVKGVTR